MDKNTKVYNKLVRDRIPDIILSSGDTPLTTILSKHEFEESLKRKLAEETQEFLESEEVEELVDIFQVILAILDEKGISFEEFEKRCRKKVFEKGEYKKRIFLISVIN